MAEKKIDLPKKADFSYIQDIAGGKNDAYYNLLKIVGKNLREYPPQILEAHESGILVEMKKLAHKYKSCTAYLNFPPLDALLNDLEYGEAGAVSNTEVQESIMEIKKLSAFLETEVERVLAEK